MAAGAARGLRRHLASIPVVRTVVLGIQADGSLCGISHECEEKIRVSALLSLAMNLFFR
jgi:hypothetical protein